MINEKATVGIVKRILVVRISWYHPEGCGGQKLNGANFKPLKLSGSVIMGSNFGHEIIFIFSFFHLFIFFSSRDIRGQLN